MDPIGVGSSFRSGKEFSLPSPGSLPVPGVPGLCPDASPGTSCSSRDRHSGVAMGRAQPTHPATLLLRVFSGVKRAGSFSAWSFSITSIPLGDAGMRWRSSWPLSDGTSKAVPVLFGRLGFFERRFQVWLNQS